MSFQHHIFTKSKATLTWHYFLTTTQQFCANILQKIEIDKHVNSKCIKIRRWLVYLKILWRQYNKKPRTEVFLQLNSLQLTLPCNNILHLHITWSYVTELQKKNTFQRIYQFGGIFKFQHTITTHAELIKKKIIHKNRKLPSIFYNSSYVCRSQPVIIFWLQTRIELKCLTISYGLVCNDWEAIIHIINQFSCMTLTWRVNLDCSLQVTTVDVYKCNEYVKMDPEDKFKIFFDKNLIWYRIADF